MGININTGMKDDYSYLFQGLSGNGSLGNLNMLSDYAAIKNGSYGKLMKAYYGGAGALQTSASGTRTKTNNVLEQILEEKKYPKVSKEAQEANSKLTSSLSSLTNSVSALQNKDTYQVSTDGTSAADKVVSAVKNYVSLYNDVVGAAKNSTLTGKTFHVAGMMRSTSENSGRLAEIGVTVKRDGTLQLDEDKLKATDLSKVQELFSKDDVMSYGSTVMARLGFASASSGSTSRVEQEDVQQDQPAYNGASALKTDIKTLLSDSLYAKKKDEYGAEKYDVESIFAAAADFVNHYNKMLEDGLASSNSGVMANLTRVMEKTAQYRDGLGQLGISVDEKGRLKIDEDVFKKSDMSQVKQFFGEYGDSIATNVSLVDYYLRTQAGAAANYTGNGTYDTQGGFRYSDLV